MSHRSCVNNPDMFCYICGKFTSVTERRNMTDKIKSTYHIYFGCKIGDQDKSWAPHFCCLLCYSSLLKWERGQLSSMPFAIPMIWIEPKNHSDDCYFCLTKISGITKRTRSSIYYPDCPSAIRPVRHDITMPVPLRNEDPLLSDSSQEEIQDDVEYLPSTFETGPKQFSQGELNDLIRDLSLSKEKSELLGSRLKEKNLLEPGATSQQVSIQT